MVKGISVVIPNFNGIELFKTTIPSVKTALEVARRPSEIIVVDDCSTDGSVKYLQENHPDIIIVSNILNSGFSITANRGIISAKFDKVLLLNSDVILTADYFLNQLKYFDKPDTFGVMARIVGWEDDHIQDGAKYPSFQGAKIKTSKNYLLKDEQAMSEGLYTMYLSGANAFMDKGKFLAIGGFNEIFSPFYVEDFELSARAWRLGFKCYFDYKSVCRHKTSTTIKNSKKKKYIDIVYNRNKMFLHAIHLNGAIKVLWYFQLFLEALLKAFAMKWSYLHSLNLFIFSSKEIKKSKIRFDETAVKIDKVVSIKEVANFIIKDTIDKEKIYF